MSKGLKTAMVTPPTDEKLTCYYKGRIDALHLHGVQVHKAHLIEDNVVIIEIFGGFNGRGTWEIYCDQIKAIVSSLQYACVACLNTDILDDVWTIQINCKNELY